MCNYSQLFLSVNLRKKYYNIPTWDLPLYFYVWKVKQLDFLENWADLKDLFYEKLKKKNWKFSFLCDLLFEKKYCFYFFPLKKIIYFDNNNAILVPDVFKLTSDQTLALLYLFDFFLYSYII